MTGIFLLVVVGLWLLLCIVVVRALLGRLRPRPWRWLVAPVVFVTLLIAPVLDEIVGAYQFRELCEKNAVFRIGVEKPEGRTTRVFLDPSNEIVPGTAITIYHSGINYVDVQSGDLVVAFDEYVARGGVLIRTLGISESNAPITIDRPSCSPEDVRGESVRRTLKFAVIN
jgi:hypothetical protein